MMNGKVVIITGGNRGIGKETAKKLAKEGAKVILGCRNLEEALLVKHDIVEETNNTNIIIKKLDLTSQKSIREFAHKINRTEERLDVLLHNAAMIPTQFQLTEDGLEACMATNHFGPFLLTHLLIDLLKKSAPSRIIITASIAYLLSMLDLNNPNPRGPSFMRIIPSFYIDSKFANICFTKELARRLKNTGVTANCFHPGVADTGIWKDIPYYFKWLVELWGRIMCFITEEEGAKTGFYLATSKEVDGVSGEYFDDCKKTKLWRSFKNEEKLKEFWETSKRLVNMKSDDPSI